jgi:hypothetical protein
MNFKELLSRCGINIGSFVLLLIAIYVIVEYIISIPRKILLIIHKYFEIASLIIAFIIVIITYFILFLQQYSDKLAIVNLTYQESVGYQSEMGIGIVLGIICIAIFMLCMVYYLFQQPSKI